MTRYYPFLAGEQEDAGQGDGQTFAEFRNEKNLSQKKVQKSLTEKKRGRKSLKEKGVVIFGFLIGA